MTHEVIMPQLGLTMTEGSVSGWLKKPGEKIEKGEVLFTVETDKVEMEVESTVSGYFAAEIAEPKHVVPVGTVIAVVVDHAEEIEPVAASRLRTNTEPDAAPPSAKENIPVATPNGK